MNWKNYYTSFCISKIWQIWKHFARTFHQAWTSDFWSMNTWWYLYTYKLHTYINYTLLIVYKGLKNMLDFENLGSSSSYHIFYLLYFVFDHNLYYIFNKNIHIGRSVNFKLETKVIDENMNNYYSYAHNIADQKYKIICHS